MDNLYAYEKRIAEAYEMDLDTYEWQLDYPLKGLYVSGIVIISKDMTMIEKNCVMAEEIAHALLTVGDILDQSIWFNRRQERVARAHAYKSLLPVDKLKEIFKLDCYNLYEIAEHFNVTIEFLRDALEYYKRAGKFFN